MQGCASGGRGSGKDAAAPEAGTEKVNLDQCTLDALAGQIDAVPAEGRLLEELHCAVCVRPSFKNPVETPCGHIYHRACLARCIAQDKVCPTCRAPVPGMEATREVSRAIRGMLNRAKVKCPQECGMEFPFEELEKHIHDDEGCRFTPLVCGNGTCAAAYQRQNAAVHRDRCAFAIVPCGACGKRLGRAELRCHLKRINCPHCHKDVPECGLDAHMHQECTAAVPMHVVMQMMQQLRQEMHKLQSSQQHLLTHTGVQIFDIALPRPLGDLLAMEGAQHELRVTGIDTPFMLSLRDGQVTVDCSLYRGPMRVSFTIAGTELPLESPPAIPTEGEPRIIRLTSRECPDTAGEYVLQPQRMNGKAVWAMGNMRIFHCSNGAWWVTADPHMGQTVNNSLRMWIKRTDVKPDTLSPCQLPLVVYTGRTGTAAPHSSITTVQRPPPPTTTQCQKDLAPTHRDAVEVRVAVFP